jgi:glycosyltransferase involved in cell wall biosynthesis
MAVEPLVSIVTPCYNSAAFLELTIASVLSQDYPHIEYFVQDGGSTDGSKAILDRYTGRLRYASERDCGPADALNRGLAQTRGEIVAWINTDDMYLPGAVSAAVRHFADHPDAGVIYGHGSWVDAEGREIGPYPTTSPYRPGMLAAECGICQPAAFMRRETLAAAGWLDADLRFAFDYELWMRMAAIRPFVAVPERLALSRMHRDNITIGKRREVFEENIAILRRHYDYVPVNWIYGYLSYRRDGRDQFFEPLRNSLAVYAASLIVGSVYNRRHLGRYWMEWASRIRTAVRRRRYDPAAVRKNASP